ncbi:hypothetical protein IHQ56_06270 [Methylobacillus flagellatus]|uniref:hypothetical protein n=1 Tax=Methylobacillus flagellatus TaxID=405 RepID=UPI002853CD27|nr:hypothetical protein [Methylobacillus flagellatus]MDR5171418.1 hypothetical protein [Methylobacillus flagellatus]
MSASFFDKIVINQEVHFKVLSDGKTYNFVLSRTALDTCAALLGIDVNEDLKRLEVFEEFEEEIHSKVSAILASQDFDDTNTENNPIDINQI